MLKLTLNQKQQIQVISNLTEGLIKDLSVDELEFIMDKLNSNMIYLKNKYINIENVKIIEKDYKSKIYELLDRTYENDKSHLYNSLIYNMKFYNKNELSEILSIIDNLMGKDYLDFFAISEITTVLIDTNNILETFGDVNNNTFISFIRLVYKTNMTVRKFCSYYNFDFKEFYYNYKSINDIKEYSLSPFNRMIELMDDGIISINDIRYMMDRIDPTVTYENLYLIINSKNYTNNEAPDFRQNDDYINTNPYRYKELYSQLQIDQLEIAIQLGININDFHVELEWYQMLVLRNILLNYPDFHINGDDRYNILFKKMDNFRTFKYIIEQENLNNLLK